MAAVSSEPFAKTNFYGKWKAEAARKRAEAAGNTSTWFGGRWLSDAGDWFRSARQGVEFWGHKRIESANRQFSRLSSANWTMPRLRRSSKGVAVSEADHAVSEANQLKVTLQQKEEELSRLNAALQAASSREHDLGLQVQGFAEREAKFEKKQAGLVLYELALHEKEQAIVKQANLALKNVEDLAGIDLAKIREAQRIAEANERLSQKFAAFEAAERELTGDKRPVDAWGNVLEKAVDYHDAIVAERQRQGEIVGVDPLNLNGLQDVARLRIEQYSAGAVEEFNRRWPEFVRTAEDLQRREHLLGAESVDAFLDHKTKVLSSVVVLAARLPDESMRETFVRATRGQAHQDLAEGLAVLEASIQRLLSQRVEAVQELKEAPVSDAGLVHENTAALQAKEPAEAEVPMNGHAIHTDTALQAKESAKAEEHMNGHALHDIDTALQAKEPVEAEGHMNGHAIHDGDLKGHSLNSFAAAIANGNIVMDPQLEREADFDAEADEYLNGHVPDGDLASGRGYANGDAHGVHAPAIAMPEEGGSKDRSKSSLFGRMAPGRPLDHNTYVAKVIASRYFSEQPVIAC